MRNPPRNAFTLVELLVVISIIGVLVGLLLPAVQQAREAARRVQCKNNLHQLALATELFHDAHNSYPPARYQPRLGTPSDYDCGGEETTWLTRVLPFLEQQAAGQRWDHQMAYADHGDEVRTFSIPAYRCPSRRGSNQSVGEGVAAGSATSYITLPCGCRVPVTTPSTTPLIGAVGDYGGNHGDLSPGAFGLPTDFYYGGNGTGIIISSRAKCSPEDPSVPVRWIDKVTHASVRDGLSNTVLIGEMHVPMDRMGKSPGDAFIFSGDQFYNSTRVGGPTVPIITDIRTDDQNAYVSWGSWHAGGTCHFAFADGSVRGIDGSIDTETLGNLCNRQDSTIIAELP